MTILALMLVPIVGWTCSAPRPDWRCAWPARTRRGRGQGLSVLAVRTGASHGGLRADGRGRRLPHPVGLQRVLLQHGERPWLDLRRAGRIRLVAPGQALLGALLFAAFDALQLRLQQSSGLLPVTLPYQLYLMLPYLSIVALVVMARRAAYPQALMKPYRKGER